MKSLSFYFLGITSYLATSTENFKKNFFSSNVLDELPIRPFWGRFVEKKPLLSSCLAPASGVTKFTKVRYMILVTLCCVARVRLRCSTMVLHKNFLKWFVKNHSKPLKHEFSNQSCERLFFIVLPCNSPNCRNWSENIIFCSFRFLIIKIWLFAASAGANPIKLFTSAIYVFS